MSEKLKRVAAQIKAILEQEDIAAVVALHTPGHGEYLCHLTPSYSCMKVAEDTIHFQSRLADFNGDEQAQGQSAEDTSNMLSLLATITSEQALILLEIAEQVDEALGAEHSGLQRLP